MAASEWRRRVRGGGEAADELLLWVSGDRGGCESAAAESDEDGMWAVMATTTWSECQWRVHGDGE